MRAIGDVQVYECNEIDKVVRKLGYIEAVKDNKKTVYYNIPCAFDIETTSIPVHSDGEEKIAYMYIWTLDLNGIIMQGRTWEEFVEVCDELHKKLYTSIDRRLIIYVHNLAYEFQFMHKWFEWHNVFALKKRQPVRATTNDGIEFRCSYKLSGYSLEVLGKNLTKYKVEKLVGDLDYTVCRNSRTKMTDAELMYCVNDVRVVESYIREQIEQYGYIYAIPTTKTGKVRNYTRNQCFYGGGSKKQNKDKFDAYRKLMKSLTLDERSYKLLKEAFAGGFTHANAIHSRAIMHDVKSMDFTSSYPYVMVSEKFPMSKPKYIQVENEDMFNDLIKRFCCLFRIRFYGLRQADRVYENYISKSHCLEYNGIVENNGRIVSAEYLATTITDVDWEIIKRFYEWDEVKVVSMYIFLPAYLPTPFIKSVLDLYKSKTELKGVEGKEVEYLNSKEMVNAEFGMCVTDICREEIEYSPFEWTATVPDMKEAIVKVNKSIKRFLYYPWGVWITAYARRNLFTAIWELGEDYVYVDTDSAKYINYEKHEEYFNRYNRNAVKKLKAAMDYHKLSMEYVHPKNIKGQEIWLGLWDDEGVYSRFKTLGAKRYMVEKNGKINITVSGLNKKTAVPYLQEQYGSRIFEAFDNDLYIPGEKTGKLTHTYIDEEREGYITDYQGNRARYYEKSAIHLSPADYSLSISQMYLDFILGKQELEV